MPKGWTHHIVFLRALKDSSDPIRARLLKSANVGQQRAVQRIFRELSKRTNPLELDGDSVRYLKRHRHKIRELANPRLDAQRRNNHFQTGHGWMSKALSRAFKKGTRRVVSSTKSLTKKAVKRAASRVKGKGLKTQIKSLVTKGVSKTKEVKAKAIDKLNEKMRDALEGSGGSSSSDDNGDDVRRAQLLRRLKQIRQRKQELMRQLK